MVFIPPNRFARTSLSLIEYNAGLDVRSLASSTVPLLPKLVCTIGPASQNTDTLRHFVDHGMSVARLNFSHGNYDMHARSIDLVRSVARERGRHIAIALDTKGPEIRTGASAKRRFDKPGEEVVVSCAEADATTQDPKVLYINYDRTVEDAITAKRILIADGVLELEVVRQIDPQRVLCRVLTRASLSGRNNVHFPDVDVHLPSVSEIDERDLAFGKSQGVDYVFASFVRNSDNVKAIRGHCDVGTKIFSKIENHQGLDNIDEIIQESDGVMVARGDLGVAIPLAKVFVAQKMIIAKCNNAAKPVICATQMLESMTKSPRPTRAEAGDVANAVLDGCDAVMLSAESAQGEYPRESVETLGQISREAQLYVRYMKRFSDMVQADSRNTDAKTPLRSVAASAVLSALELQASVILTATTSGNSVRQLTRYCPPCPVVAVCQTYACARSLAAVRGVFATCDTEVPSSSSQLLTTFERAVEHGIAFIKKEGLAKEGETVIVTCTDVFPGSPAKASMIIRTI